MFLLTVITEKTGEIYGSENFVKNTVKQIY